VRDGLSQSGHIAKKGYSIFSKGDILLSLSASPFQAKQSKTSDYSLTDKSYPDWQYLSLLGLIHSHFSREKIIRKLKISKQKSK